MKRPITFKSPGIRPRQEVSTETYDDSVKADERVPIDLNAVRWIVAATLAFWLMAVCVGFYFIA